MAFDPTITWQSVVTVLAVLSSWLLAFGIDASRSAKRRLAIRRTVSLYLDALEIKVGAAINRYFVRGVKVATGRDSFESQNRSNHEVLERLFASEDLSAGDTSLLADLLTFLKTSPTMSTHEDFVAYQKRLRDPVLRRAFPKSPGVPDRLLEVVNKPDLPSRDTTSRRGRKAIEQ